MKQLKIVLMVQVFWRQYAHVSRTNLIAFIGLFSLLTACEDDYLFYDRSNTLIQFGPEPGQIYNSSFNLADTIKTYSFVYEGSSVMRDTVYFDLYALGGPVDADRTFAIKQVMVNNEPNAEAGKHYLGFDDPEVAGLYTIKAGEVHLSLPLVLLRDESLRSGTYVLKIELEDDENFRIGDPDLIWRKLYFSDQLIRPTLWSIFEEYSFGKYSEVKHRFMIDVTGEKWDDEFFSALYSDYSYLLYWRATMVTELSQYNSAHPNDPLRDENGELVTFP
ncbi:DUF4843 domain-containing protein [Maribellus sediminis]|uniref:DUF4843 domain-containing protein n=1 Tax=Maribellus sediminis TaxID=2696285 RepID=UPI0014303AE1|nr:DUF4843 domain-containing protein [Maribellus sediminis]